LGKKSVITKTQSWPRIHGFYADLLDRHQLPVTPIIQLLAWLKKEQMEEQLYAFTSMHDLVITDSQEFDWDHHTLRISPDFASHKIRFEYARHSGATDVMRKEVAEAEAIEALRQFLAYKFGVHRRAE
jgi:hypothetical protein